MSEKYFTERIFYRFLVPSVLSTLCLAVANLVDALCAGMLLGEAALAAIDLVSPIFMIYNVLDIGMGVGGAVIFTRNMSDGHPRKALSSFTQMLMAALASSVLIGVLGLIFIEPVLHMLGTRPEHGTVYEMTKDYAIPLLMGAPLFFLDFLFYNFVRCDDGEKLASASMAVSNILDVVLTVVLVLGLKMGVKGAIYATLIGTGTGVLMYLPHFFNPANILSFKFEKPDFSVIKECYLTGFSSSSQYILRFIFFLIINNLLMRRYGTASLAIFNVVLNMSYLVVGLYDGVASSIQPVAATFCGERNRKAQHESLEIGLKWGLFLGAVLLAGIAVFATQLCALFGLEGETLNIGSIALRCYCAGGLFLGVSMLLSSYWQSVGLEKRTLLLTFLRNFAVYITLAVPLTFAPVRLFWLVFPGTEILSLLIFALWLKFGRDKEKFSEKEESSAPVFQGLIREEEEFSALLEAVDEFCAEQDASMSQNMLIIMAVEEMCSVIFSHAKTSKDFYIQITLFEAEEGMFELHIRDSGVSFDPFSLRTSKITEARDEDEAMDSIGIHLVKKKAKECIYRNYQGFNTLTVRL